MRTWIAVAGLLAAGPCWGQSSSAQDAITAIYQIQIDVSLAFDCHFRDAAWFASRVASSSQTAMFIAIRSPAEVGGLGGVEGAKRFVYGSALQSAQAATAEFQNYGGVACARLMKGGLLAKLDALQ